MDLRDRSLDLAPTEAHGRGSTWPVVGDIALSLVLVLVLFILAQFLHYDLVFVFEKIDQRRTEMERLVQAAAGEVLASADVPRLEIFSEGSKAQRIRFPEAMLFESCGTVPRPDGARLIQAVGRAIGERASYFESVQIEGHADRRPPTGECQRRLRDNWGLSSARATEFVRVLVQPAVFPGVHLVSAVGRGDSQPLISELPSDADLDHDRRVELILVYSEPDARDALNGPPNTALGNRDD
jgi:outer membrane protein OmpA-like peptidoglycan-associated protein